MPVLREPAHLGRILAKRVEVTGIEEPFAGLFTDTAVDACSTTTPARPDAACARP